MSDTMPPRDVPEKFLVAFSFAGEQRDLVRSIAEAVEAHLGRSTVFFDEWYEHYIAGADADLRLEKIYREDCALAVVCVSRSYNDKPWTGGEYLAIRDRVNKSRIPAASEEDKQGMLFIRVAEGDVAGIFSSTDIAPDIRQKSLEQTVELIVNRLRLVASRSHHLALSQVEPAEWNALEKEVNAYLSAIESEN